MRIPAFVKNYLCCCFFPEENKKEKARLRREDSTVSSKSMQTQKINDETSETSEDNYEADVFSSISSDKENINNSTSAINITGKNENDELNNTYQVGLSFDINNDSRFKEKIEKEEEKDLHSENSNYSYKS